MEARTNAMTETTRWRVVRWAPGQPDELLGIIDAVTQAEASRLGSQQFGEPEAALLIERVRLRP